MDDGAKLEARLARGCATSLKPMTSSHHRTLRSRSVTVRSMCPKPLIGGNSTAAPLPSSRARRVRRVGLVNVDRSPARLTRSSRPNPSCRTTSRFESLVGCDAGFAIRQTRRVPSLGGFEAFVAAHERRLRQALTAAFGLDGGREAAADAFAFGWEHWDRVAAMANPAGYLFVVGRDRYRRRFRNRLAKPVFDIGPDHPEPWCEPALAAQLAGLSDRERVAVMLVNGFEWSLAEVAELFGVSKNTVQTHAERGMAKLRRGWG